MRFSESTIETVRWQDRALCAERAVPADAFFPETKPDPVAKRLCGQCPVREECLAYALDHQAVGIWGGTSTKERRRMSRGLTPTDRSPATVEHWLATAG